MVTKKKTTIKSPSEKSSLKDEKLFQNLLKNTRDYLTGRSYKPLSCKELREKLNFPTQHAVLFRSVLKALVKEGIAVLEDSKYHVKKKLDNTVQGILTVHPRGFAFLQLEKGSQYNQDIFIPKHLTLNAVDGDTVEVEVNPDAISEKGPEGRVISIIQRGRTHLAGIVKSIDSNNHAWVYVPLLGPQRAVYVEQEKTDHLIVGDRIVMSVQTWGERDAPTVCTLRQRIGHITDPACDVPAAIEEFELRETFSSQVMEEVKAFGTRVQQSAIAGRLDLREVETFTIDPTTAKDFDDAISLRKDRRGNYHLGVHIADVSHYVKPGTALDTEARLRCNSTYFPGKCVPMLPSALSDNLCSLKANVNRLTVSVMMKINKEGEVVDYSIERSVIKSNHRFTYEEAKEVIDGKRRSKHAPTLHLLTELCQVLKRQRYLRGSIEFSLPELVIIVDENGVPQGTRKIEYDITHQLVEECMLKANELVAIHLNKAEKEIAYRIHDQPSLDNVREFIMIARAFGFKVPDEPTPMDFQELFTTAIATPMGEYLANSYIRRMRLACYSEENIGHFGLSLQHYTHFTSPIRRYIDLVIHRSLFEHDYDAEEIAKIALECSDQERVSARAEQNVLLLKKLRWVTALKAQHPLKQYEAIVTRVKPFGMYFEVLEVMLEGFAHISEIGSDYYIYDERKMRLRGEHTNEIFCVGTKVTVMLKSVDCITMESQWELLRSRSTFSSKNKHEDSHRPKKHKRDKKGRRPR